MLKTPSPITRTALAFATILLIATTAQADVQTYAIDKTHSNVNFKIRHMLSKATGSFPTFSGTIALDPDKRDAVTVSAEIDVASINTAEPKRDAHLRGEDFFDVAKYPTMTFTGGELSEVNADRTKGKLSGTLTLRGVSKPVVLDVEWFGVATDPWGNTKAAFSGTTTIDRKDFGMVYNKALDNGGLLVGNEVEIEINIEAQVPKQ